MYPHERSLVERMANRPFALIGVNSDRDKEKLKERMKEEEITWRSFWNGEQGTGGPISQKWNISGWPSMYIVDHKGIIRHKSVGSPGEETVDKWVDALVEAAETE